MDGKGKEQLDGWEREGAAGWLVNKMSSRVAGKENKQLGGW